MTLITAFVYTRKDKGNNAKRNAYKDYGVRDDQPGNYAKRRPRFETLRRLGDGEGGKW